MEHLSCACTESCNQRPLPKLFWCDELFYCYGSSTRNKVVNYTFNALNTTSKSAESNSGKSWNMSALSALSLNSKVLEFRFL